MISDVRSEVSLLLQDVHFGYTGEREVVGGVSLTIEPGQSVALVGPSGSGKSTILKLLVRLYDTTSGSVYLDGIEARELQQASHQCVLYKAQGALSCLLPLFEGLCKKTVSKQRPCVSPMLAVM